jgi:membrane protein YqaA with SNARE-associated domain
MSWNSEGGGFMSAVALVGGIFLLAFVSAFVPVVSIELALVVAAATGTSGALLFAQVLVAAAGQMVGKSCFFVGGRTAFRYWRRREDGCVSPRIAGLHRLVARVTRERAVAAVTVFISALTGIPPLAVVSALAGGWRIRLPSFFLIGFTGRSARFGTVLMVPHALAW